jgi:hypothetical protein
MKRLAFLAILAVVISGCGKSNTDNTSSNKGATPDGASTRPTDEKVLYRKPLGDGRELVVLQSAVVPPAGLKDMLSLSAPGGGTFYTAGFCSVDVELRSASNPTLRLWSRPYELTSPAAYEKFEVLDLVVLPNQVVLALSVAASSNPVAASSPTIGIAQIGLLTPSRYAEIWQPFATQAVPNPPPRLGAKLMYDEKRQIFEIDATLTVAGVSDHFPLEQKGTDWEFVQVKNPRP